jgi:hypothetical protein
MYKSLAFVACIILAGCGGGGGSTTVGTGSPLEPVVVSTNQFSFQTAWKKFNSVSYSKNLTVSGSCAGTLTYTRSAASQPIAFDYSDLSFPHPTGNVNPGYYVWNQEQVTTDLPGCSTWASSTVTKLYYDATTFAPFGYNGGTGYNGATSYKATFREFSARVVLPDIIKVGDKGVVGSVLTYGMSNFKKSGTPQGQTDVTYIIEPDTSTTAIINIVSKVYDASGKLTLTDQTRYQIDATNTMVLTSIDQQYSDAITLHLFAK